VTDADGAHLPGEYVSGWIKRGPSGVIGTNKKDAQDTVTKIIEDAAAGRLNEPVSDDIDGMIASCAEHAVTWEGWLAIDAVETSGGQAASPARPRVKLTEWEALREAARSIASRSP
jgi:ferredoxin--NADP+ reductase